MDNESSNLGPYVNTGHAKSEPVASKESLPLEQTADRYTRLIRESGIAALHGKFPLCLTTSDGVQLAQPNNFENFCSVGIVGVLPGEQKVISVLNSIEPKYGSALYSNRHKIQGKMFASLTRIEADRWRDLVKSTFSENDANFGFSQRLLQNCDDGVLLTTLFAYIADNPNLGPRGSRGQDLMLKFRYAIPTFVAEKNNLIGADMKEIMQMPYMIYERMYPGIQKTLLTRPASEIYLVKPQPGLTSESSDYDRWAQAINSSARYPLDRTVGLAATT